MAKHKRPGTPRATASTTASRQAMKGLAARLDMRKHDPWAITAAPDPHYHGHEDHAYVHRTTDDLYGFLVTQGRAQDDR